MFCYILKLEPDKNRINVKLNTCDNFTFSYAKPLSILKQIMIQKQFLITNHYLF